METTMVVVIQLQLATQMQTPLSYHTQSMQGALDCRSESSGIMRYYSSTPSNTDANIGTPTTRFTKQLPCN